MKGFCIYWSRGYSGNMSESSGIFRLRYLILCFVLIFLSLALEGYKQKLALITHAQMAEIDKLKERWSLLSVKKEKLSSLKSLVQWAERRKISQRDLDRIIILPE